MEPLGKDCERADFSSGHEGLDRYLKNQAGQDARRKVAAPLVLLEAGARTAWGYYTLSAFGIDMGDLPKDVARRLPRYPVIPATLFGHLAVDTHLQGHGLGEFLLIDALRRAFEQSDQIAATAVVLDAVNDTARWLYLRFDFLPFSQRRDRLFLTMKTLGQLFR